MDFLRDLFVYDPQRPLIFTTGLFWLCFGFVLLVFPLVHNRRTARNLFLLAFSLFFYYKSSGFYFTLLLLTTVVDFAMGWAIFRAPTQSRKKIFVTISLLLNLGLLAYFKYAYFFTDSVNWLLGYANQAFDWALPALAQPVNYLAQWTNAFTGTNHDIGNIILPVGISFYTFQSISYAVDIYRGTLKPVNSILDFAFFVSFFPQLVAGPIVRASEFVPQIYEPYRVSKEDYNRALFLIAAGLVKKILISDYISINFVDRIFASPGSYTGFENLMAVYGYTIQIYCDFSGYTDIAIGVALLLGFRLTWNFNSPYKASSITEFWRRWHISLSTWLRDYLYISLGGNRQGRFRTYLNLFITMLLGGLWHGASLRFLLWGALHGAALAVHKLWLSATGREAVKPTGFRRFVGQVITFHFVAFCWIFFRAEDMGTAGGVLTQIGSNFAPELIPQMIASYAAVFGLMALAYLIHWLPKGLKEYPEVFFGYTPDLGKALFFVLLVLGLYQVKSAAVQPFIYFQF